MAEFKLLIRARDQEADLFCDRELMRTFKVSTGANGLGCEMGTGRTPLGLLKVAQKIGEGCVQGAVFRSRVATGEIWSTDGDNPLRNSLEDLVLTRILWLEGAETLNANTKERYIYLHGTNQEHLLGSAVSHGCVRFSNSDIEELFEILPEGAMVEVVE